MRIIAIFEIIRIVVRKVREPSKKKIRLKEERSCFEGLRDSLEEDQKNG